MKRRYERLKSTGGGERPKDLDPAALEKYLDDDAFFKLFQISLVEFGRLPAWKQQRMKKLAFLF